MEGLGSVQDVYDYCRDLVQDSHCLLVVALDQRNHGKRVVDLKCNEGWVNRIEPSNKHHAIDMYANQLGTAKDISLLMDFLPAKLGLTSSKEIRFGVTGISLGGHASLLTMAIDRRISVCASLIGCGDYRSLMETRAKQNKSPFDNYYPPTLQKVVDLYDPINNVDKFEGKPLIIINGGSDNLVPSDCNKNFITSLEEEYRSHHRVHALIWKVHPGVKHQVTGAMWAEAKEFLIKNIFLSETEERSNL